MKKWSSAVRAAWFVAGFVAPLPPLTHVRSQVSQSMLEVQLEAAAGGRFEGLLGVVVQVVAPQPATDRCK